MRRASKFLLLAALVGLPACGAETGDGLKVFGDEAVDRERATYTSTDHPRALVQLDLQEDGSFLLGIRNLKNSMMKVEEEELTGTWRIDDNVLKLESGKLTMEYLKGPVSVDIPGFKGELQGLSWQGGSEKCFATGFQLADDGELEEVMSEIFGG